MRLARLAAVTLNPRPKDAPPSFRLDSDAASVEVIKASGVEPSKPWYVIRGLVPIAEPSVNAEGLLEVPAGPRAKAEAMIQHAADLLSVTARCQRSLGSCAPSFAFVPENDADRRLLARAVGVSPGISKAPQVLSSPLDLALVSEAVLGRWDGLALLAEALAHSRASGRYRDLVRFFEMAFQRPFTVCAKKLNQFLRVDFGYTVSEIRNWQNLRHPFAHADRAGVTGIATEHDARPVVGRMTQAAYDVLLNKAEWRSFSSGRRDTWQATAFTADSTGSGVVVQGSPARIEVQVLDEFGVFPINAEIGAVGIPDDWWTTTHSHTPRSELDTHPPEGVSE